MNRELLPTPAFLRAVRRHLKKHPQDAGIIDATFQLLTANAFDPRLRTHNLKGDLEGVWACSAGYDLRLLFEFVQHKNAEANLVLTMGSHEEVY